MALIWAVASGCPLAHHEAVRRYPATYAPQHEIASWALDADRVEYVGGEVGRRPC